MSAVTKCSGRCSVRYLRFWRRVRYRKVVLSSRTRAWSLFAALNTSLTRRIASSRSMKNKPKPKHDGTLRYPFRRFMTDGLERIEKLFQEFRSKVAHCRDKDLST